MSVFEISDDRWYRLMRMFAFVDEREARRDTPLSSP